MVTVERETQEPLGMLVVVSLPQAVREEGRVRVCAGKKCNDALSW